MIENDHASKEKRGEGGGAKSQNRCHAPPIRDPFKSVTRKTHFSIRNRGEGGLRGGGPRVIKPPALLNPAPGGGRRRWIDILRVSDRMLQ